MDDVFRKLFLNLKKSGWFLKQIHLTGFVVTPWLTNRFEGKLRALKSIQTRIMPIVVGNSLQLVILWQLESRKKNMFFLQNVHIYTLNNEEKPSSGAP